MNDLQREQANIKMELIISDLLVRVWNTFLELDPQHPDELNDFKNGIHQLQYVLMARGARRSNPEIYSRIIK